MKALVIIICVVLVAGLVIGLAPQQVWAYILGVFTECAKWFGTILKQIVDSMRDASGIAG